MKKRLLILFLFVPLVAQQTIKTATITLNNGQTIRGEVTIIEQSNSIKFVNARESKYIRFDQVESVKDKNNKVIWTLYQTVSLSDGRIIKGVVNIVENDKSIKITRNNDTQYFHFEKVINVKGKEEEIIWSHDEWIKKQIEAMCTSNKTVRVLILPFKDDYYGLSQMIEENYDSLCYNRVENISALEYLYKENIKLNEINDYHLLNIGKTFSVDIIIYGYAYTIDVPFKYSPTSSDPLAVTTLWESDYNDPWNILFNSLGRAIIVGGQQIERGQAISEAGSYVILTYFALNIDTGKKLFILKNKKIMKVG